MSDMRNASRLCFCLLVLSPIFVIASTVRPPMTPSKCPAGSSTEVTGPKSIMLTRSTKPEDAKRFLQTSVHCPNACYNTQVTMTLTNSGMRVDVTAAHLCTDREKAPNDPSQRPKRGCAAGEQVPQITVSTKNVYSTILGFKVKDQTVVKSRCDGEAIDASVNKFFNGLSQVTSDPTSAEAQMQAALDDLQKQSAPVPTVPLPQNTGTAALSKVLTGQFDGTGPERQQATQTLINAGNVLSIGELKRMLPKQIMHQTLMAIIDYLEYSGKITLHDNKVLWTFKPQSKLRKMKGLIVR